MKIILDKEVEEGKDVVKEKKVKAHVKEVKEPRQKYIVTSKNSGNAKQIAALFLGLVGGIIGGVFATFIAIEVMGDNKVNTTTNSTVTSYNFSTVENPVVAISKQVGPSVVGVKVQWN